MSTPNAQRFERANLEPLHKDTRDFENADAAGADHCSKLVFFVKRQSLCVPIAFVFFHVIFQGIKAMKIKSIWIYYLSRAAA